VAVSYTVSSAKLPIVPDLTGFHRKIKTLIRSERVDAPVAVTPDFDKFAERLETGLRRFNARIGVQVFPDLTGFGSRMRAQLRADRSELQVPLEVDLTQARATMAAFRAEVAAQPITARLDIDTANALAQLAAVRTAARGIADMIGPNGGASRQAGQAAQQLTGGPIRRIRMQLEIDRSSIATAQAEVEAVAARIASSRQKEADAADKVTLAERRLSEVRSRAGSDSSQLLAAQNALTRAQRDYADQNARTSGLIGNQADAHRRLQRAQRDNGNTSRLFGAAIGGIAESASKLGTRLTSIISPASAAAGALLALAAVNIIPLIGQLTQAAGVLSLLPAAGAAAAASLATVVIGFTGVFDAFSAGSKASESASADAAAAAKTQAAAAKQVDSAQRGVASAVKQVEKAEDGVTRAERGVADAQKQSQRAQEDLTQARKDAQEQIEDLNLALKGSSLDERDAELSLRRAQQRLAELGKDGQPVTMLDFDEAVLGVDQAKQRIDEVRERNADLKAETDAANKAGVDGSQQVVQAQEAVADADLRVVDSKQAVVDAQEAVADAQAGVADAQANLAEAQAAAATATAGAATAADKYAEALANLSPNARDFVERTRELGDAWKDLRLVVQDNLFDGLGTSITELANRYFPELQTGLGGIATEINGGIRRSLADLGSESSQLDWSKIFENTRQAIGPLLDGLNDLWGSLTNIAAIGSEFLPGFGDSFSNVMQEFREFTESEEGQNKIRTFMQDSIEALKSLLDLFGAIGRVIGGLFSTSEKNGKSMIESMTAGLNEFADWLNSEEGKQRMSQFWDDAQQTAKDLLRLTGEAIKLADKVAGIAGGNYGLTTPNRPEQGVDPQGNPTATTGAPLKYQAGIFPGVTEGSVGDKVLSGFGSLDDFFAGGAWSFLDPKEGESPFEAAMRRAGASVGGLKDKAKELAVGLTADIGTTAATAWVNFGDKVDAIKTSVSDRIGQLMTRGGELRDDVSTKLSEMGISWDNLGGGIGSVITTMVDTAFPGLTTALSGVQTFFGNVVDSIGTKWDQLKDLAAKPINWIIDTVINGTLKNAWNAVADLLGLPEWQGVARIETPQGQTGGIAPKPLNRASGGPVFGAGGPTDDKVPAMLSNGEYVLRASSVKKIGIENLNRLNTNPVMARGKVLGEGMFAGVRMAVGGSVDEAVERAKRFMSGEHGKPYQYGGVGDPSWDCSGLWSGIVNVINGRAATAGRLFSTESDFESMGWTPGLGGRVTIGISRGGGGPNSHMGGTIDGTNAESSGGNGVQWGGAARGSDTFPLTYTLQELAGQFVSGGPGSGGGGGGIMSSIRNRIANQVASLFEAPLNALGSQIPSFGDSQVGQLPKLMYEKIKNAAVEFVRSKIAGASGGSADSGNTPFAIGAGAEQWRPNVIEALKREGYPVTDENINLTLSQIGSESSGNPNAVQQVVDVNTGGNEAVGLMQIAKGTWPEVRNPDLPNDRTNPDASISAGLRYMKQKHGGNLAAMWGQGHGYDSGGIFPDGTIGWNTSGKPEAVLTNTQWQLFDGFNKNLAHFATGGYVDPQEYARNRFQKYGEQVGGIVKSAIPEILGISGTPLDPTNNRYIQAAMDLQSSFAAAAPSASANYGSSAPPASSTVVDQARGVVEQHTHFHVSSIDEAFRKHQLEQQKAAMAFGGR